MWGKQSRFLWVCVVLVSLGLWMGSFPEPILAQVAAPSFEPAACPVEVPEEASVACGYLVAPEDYANPAGATVRLPVIILHSRSPNPAPDPVLYTEGGPGFSSLGAVWYFAESAFLEKRDVVILEQRGNVCAQPDLVCDASMWLEERVGHTPCLDSLRAEGIDPSHYHTANVAADIHSLRQVLPYEQWNLFGSSYSTRPMQLTMKLYPEGVRSVMLNAVGSITDTRYQHDPEHTMRAIQLMLDDCAALPACAEAYPELEAQFARVVARLNQEPIRLQSTDAGTGEKTTEFLNGTKLIEWMVIDSFYDPAWPPHKSALMPLIIDQLDQGKAALARAWLAHEQDSRWLAPGFAWGLYFAINCQDDGNGISSGMLANQSTAYPQLGGYVRAAREVEICEAWGLPPVPISEEPLSSDIPTLIMAGSYDPITAPEWGRALAGNLSRSYFFEFPGWGHNVDQDNPCSQRMKAAFLDNPAVEPNSSCMADLPGASFILPEEVSFAPGMLSSISDISVGDPTVGKPLLEFAAVASLALFLLFILYQLILGVVNLVRRRKELDRVDTGSRLLNSTAGATGILAFALLIMLSTINQNLTSFDRALLGLGLLAQSPLVQLVTLLVLLYLLLTIGLVLLTAVDWRRRGSFSWRGAFMVLVACAALLYSGILVRWDLHLLLLV